jgi:NAD(P)-dependent dehydrogenase (short-subunit alcohol dehydrogenase family)
MGWTGRAHAPNHDVTSEADWIAVIAQAQDVLGGLSVLVNNAGIAQVGSVEDLSFAEWRRG